MKIVTYNIQFGSGKDGRIDLGRIAQTVDGADVIALQEVDRNWRRSGMTDQVAELTALLNGYHWVYGRHILPNIASALIVNMTLNFPGTVLMETSLSFLGLGIQPPLTSLGNMLGFGRDYLTTAWWIAVLPGMTIFFATLAMSLLGDWVRDRLDPTLK